MKNEPGAVLPLLVGGQVQAVDVSSHPLRLKIEEGLSLALRSLWVHVNSLGEPIALWERSCNAVLPEGLEGMSCEGSRIPEEVKSL